MEAPAPIRDLKHVHERLGDLAKLVGLHVTSMELTDPYGGLYQSILRARAKTAEALDRMEGKKQ